MYIAIELDAGVSLYFGSVMKPEDHWPGKGLSICSLVS